MKKNMINGLSALTALVLLSGCVASENRITQVNEVQYPKGITVSIYDEKIKDGVAISDARMAYTDSKNQVQFVINNNSEDVYNLKVSSEWTDKRGVLVPTYPQNQTLSLSAKSGKRMIVKAPNFKAKNVLLNIECGSNCVIKKK